MKVKSKLYDDVCVLTLKGKMMGGPESSKLREEIKSHLENNTLKFVIDMKNVKWLNSLGVGVLMGAFTTVKNAGGDVCLASLTEKAQSLLFITKLIQVFKTYENIDAALESYKNN